MKVVAECENVDGTHAVELWHLTQSVEIPTCTWLGFFEAENAEL